ncbi:hypothetical protein [Streptomyces sp. BE147]|nr:hypothetical protein [Streptomyces sp. BE147]MEE1738864.1 hypothetical protein [Streptomyces sp. BE147]
MAQEMWRIERAFKTPLESRDLTVILVASVIESQHGEGLTRLTW